MSTSTPQLNGSLFGYAQLVRLPNLFTAIADPLMGALFVLPVDQSPDMWLLASVGSAACLLYAGGVVLNDVFDARRDERERPERPIPSGNVPREAAKLLAMGLLAAGVLVGFMAALLIGHFGPAVMVLLLAGCIVLYDGYAKLTPFGPPVMGLCRALNVLLGMSLMTTPWQVQHWLVAAAVGVYITGISYFSRGEAQTSRRPVLVFGLAIILGGIGLLALLPLTETALVALLVAQPERWYFLMAMLGLLIGWRFFRAVLDPEPGPVQQAVGHGILSLVLLDAAVVYAVRGMPSAVMVLALVIPAMFLGRMMRMS